MNITAIVLAKNEEKNIESCLKSLIFCNEIMVIDDQSDDTTVVLAKKHNAKIIKHSLNNDFSQQRNFALSKSKNDWVLFIDADERVSKELQNEILQTIHSESKVSGYYIQRYDFMWGKFLKHGETGDIYVLRLIKKNTGKWVGKVHETWVSTEKTRALKHSLLHYPHINTREFLSEINFYSTLRSGELFDNHIKTNWFQIVCYPSVKFIYNYFLKLGFLDGIPGLLLAILMSFHSFLVRGKLWQLWEKNEI